MNNKLSSYNRYEQLDKIDANTNKLSKERGSFLASKSMRKSKSSNQQWVMPSYSKWTKSTSDYRSNNSKIIQVLQCIYQKLVIIYVHALAFFI